jgi:hypothetical protein
MVCLYLSGILHILAASLLGWLSNHRLPNCSLNKEQGLRLGKFGCTVAISGLLWYLIIITSLLLGVFVWFGDSICLLDW